MRPLPRHHPQRHVTVIIAGQALAVTEEEEEEEGVTEYRLLVQCVMYQKRGNIKQHSHTLHLGVLRGKSADRSNDPTSDQHGTDMG